MRTPASTPVTVEVAAPRAATATARMAAKCVRIAAALTALTALDAVAHRPLLAQRGGTVSAEPGAVRGLVLDSATGRPVPDAQVSLAAEGRIVTAAATDPFGRLSLRALRPGRYTLHVRALGFRPATRALLVGAGDPRAPVTVRLAPATVSLQAVEISAARHAVAVDTHSGDQVFNQHDYHGAPTSTTSQILQQAVAGAARAPTGEVHIRGQHAEYTYYVDGVPVPAGISGSLNELFDPAVVDQLQVQTGGWDAEYGNKNIAVVNVATRIPAGGFRVQGSAYAGSFQSAGQTLTTSTNVNTRAGPFGLFLSGTRQSTGMRREPVMRDPGTRTPLNFHNAGEDVFGFAKAQYTRGATDVVNLEANWSRTRLAVPFDSTGGHVLDDHQADGNGFLNLGWRHLFEGPAVPASQEAPELFAAAYYRRGTLRYTPGAVDEARFLFYPDTATPYTVREARTADTYGVKFDYGRSVGARVRVKMGTEGAFVRGREDFDTQDRRGAAGPTVHAGVRGGDAGAYAQAVVTLAPAWELRPGVRVDAHVAPLAGTQHQVSPRLRLNWRPGPATTLWAYYGRLFIPSNVEDFHALAGGAQGGRVGLPTVPERDHYVELGYVHRYATGVATKLAAYHRQNGPAVDDNTLPGTALTTSVNIARVRVTGVEAVVDVQPRGPLSGALNVALNHARAHGPITGGFFPTAYPAGWFDQDHDQRVSAVGTLTYTRGPGFVGTTVTYGSGLTNGHPEAAPNATGLFAFNRGVKVAPSAIVNASAGYTLVVGRALVEPQFNVENVFDRRYLLKGAFTSGPSVGRPRGVVLRVSVSP